MDFWKKRGGNSNLKSLTTPIFVQGEVTTPFLPVHMCNIPSPPSWHPPPWCRSEEGGDFPRGGASYGQVPSL